MTREELIEHIIDEGIEKSPDTPWTEEELNGKSNEELLDIVLEWEGIIGFTEDIKEWAMPYFQEYFSQHPDELNLDTGWIIDKAHQLEGCDIEEESEPGAPYPEIFNLDTFIP